MNEEHRRAPRKRLQQFLLVLDHSSRQTLGRMVDISNTGMMLISSQPLPLQQELLLEIGTPEDSGLPTITLTARTVWVRSSNNNLNHHGCGLEFSNITAEAAALVEALIRLQDAG